MKIYKVSSVLEKHGNSKILYILFTQFTRKKRGHHVYKWTGKNRTTGTSWKHVENEKMEKRK